MRSPTRQPPLERAARMPRPWRKNRADVAARTAGIRRPLARCPRLIHPVGGRSSGGPRRWSTFISINSNLAVRWWTPPRSRSSSSSGPPTASSSRRDELAVGGPLLLELRERGGVHHRTARFELMDMNVDHLRGPPDERPPTGWINRGQRASGLRMPAVRAATSARFFRHGLGIRAALSSGGCRVGDRIRQRFGETAVAPVVHMQAVRGEKYLERDT